MDGIPKRLAGPAYLANAAANIYTPPASTIVTVITHIHLINKDTASQTFALYVGATGGSAGGTELFGGLTPLAANTPMDYYCEMPMASTDFLTGVASAASKIVIIVEGYQYVV
jgi:hypothetical protein